MPKLSRVEIDVDYSHMLGQNVQDQLLRSAAAFGIHNPRAPPNPSAAHARDLPPSPFDEPAELHDESSSQPMRLRGGKSPRFSPSASTCDLGPVLRGGSVVQAGEDTLKDNSAAMASHASHYRPKLSRTVDIH